jgi:hypothetical protein
MDSDPNIFFWLDDLHCCCERLYKVGLVDKGSGNAEEIWQTNLR